jgi:WD repeat-containing protein 61
VINVIKIAELKGHNSPVYALAAADEQHLFYSAGSDRMLALWSLKTMSADNFLAQFNHPVYSVLLLANEALLIAGNANGQLHIIDLNTRQEIKCLQVHSAPVFCLLHHSETGILISGGADGLVTAMKTGTWEMLWQLKIPVGKIRQLRFNQMHQALMVCAGDGTLKLLDIVKGNVIIALPAHAESCNTATEAFGREYLITGGKDAHLSIYRNADFALVKRIPAHNYAVYDLAESPCGIYLASASRDKTVKIWNQEMEVLKRINLEQANGHTHSVNRLLWSSYHNFLISAGDDKKILVWKIAEGV